MTKKEVSHNPKIAEKVIAVVEDDEAIAELFCEELRKRKLGVRVFDRAGPFQEWIAQLTEMPDAVILDLGLPDFSGLQLLRRLDTLPSKTPFLVLSSWHDAQYRRECFRLGAADFVAKPFDLQEVVLRIERLLSHRMQRDLFHADILRIGSGFLHCQFKVLTDPLRGETSLSHLETKLLRKLTENIGQLVPRDVLFAEVWSYGEGAVSRTLDVYVSKLRRILHSSLSRAPLIENMRGEGYMLKEQPLTEAEEEPVTLVQGSEIKPITES
jgi:DNA-binding response OmpR family regulator